MNIRQAIATLEMMRLSGLFEGGIEDVLETAVSSLEHSQTKIPLILTNSNGIKEFFCPSCKISFPYNKEENNYHKYSYCPHCGQAVEWGGVTPQL